MPFLGKKFGGSDSERRSAAAIRAILTEHEQFLRTRTDLLPEPLRRRQEELILAIRTLCALTTRENLARLASSAPFGEILNHLGLHPLHLGDAPRAPTTSDGGGQADGDEDPVRRELEQVHGMSLPDWLRRRLEAPEARSPMASRDDRRFRELVLIASHLTPGERWQVMVPSTVLLALGSEKLPSRYQLSDAELESAERFAGDLPRRAGRDEIQMAEAGPPGASDDGCTPSPVAASAYPDNQGLLGLCKNLLRKAESSRWMPVVGRLTAEATGQEPRETVTHKPALDRIATRKRASGRAGTRRETVMMALGAVIALAVLGRLVPRLDWTAGSPDGSDAPDAGVVVHIEVDDIWMPRPLMDMGLATRNDQRGAYSLQSVLDQLHGEGLEQLWFVTFTTSISRDGRAAQIKRILYPCRDIPHDRWLIEAVLETAAGRPPAMIGETSFSSARVHVIPDGLLARDPMKVIPELERLQKDGMAQ